MSLCMSPHNAHVCVCVCWQMGTRSLIIWLNQFSFRQLFLSADENLFQGTLLRTIESISLHRSSVAMRQFVCSAYSFVWCTLVLKYWKAIWFERARSSSAKSQVHLGEQPLRKFKNISQSNRYIYCRLLRQQTNNRFEKNLKSLCFSVISRMRWITVAYTTRVPLLCVVYTCDYCAYVTHTPKQTPNPNEWVRAQHARAWVACESNRMANKTEK